jgi:RimJ/RimL family protein N-acetyltransferase
MGSMAKRQPQSRGFWQDGAVVEILTKRLRLRPFQADDLPAFVAYRREPEVARYQGWDTAYSMIDAERFLASQEGVEFGVMGAWVQLAAIDLLSGALCGDCAVHVVADQPATAEVGVTFAPRRQGSGLATEALAAVITKLFDEHELHRVYAEADDRNVAVHRLFERLRFRCQARLVESDRFKREWSTLRIFAVLRREWESA